MATESFQRHTLRLQASDAASAEASAWARALAEQAGLSEERTYALDLCIVELVTNVVDHGYQKRAGELELDLDLARAAAILTITDAAPAFDPLAYPPPVVAASIEEASIGGYGIHLVRSTADQCRYERRGDRNVFTAYFGHTLSLARG